MYCSDDYAGMTIGPLEFYYGYEVSKCLDHPDKSDEYCDQVSCDGREWCFEVSLDDRTIWLVSMSELEKMNPDNGLYSPLEFLVAGVETYFRENKHLCSLHLIDEQILSN